MLIHDLEQVPLVIPPAPNLKRMISTSLSTARNCAQHWTCARMADPIPPLKLSLSPLYYTCTSLIHINFWFLIEACYYGSKADLSKILCKSVVHGTT